MSAGRRASAQPDTGAPIRLVVADDHPLWRETLKGLLEYGGTAEVVAEAATGDEVVALVATVDADVVLLDIDMPHTNGIDAVRAITTAKPGIKVLMLSSSKERAEVLASVRGGASGYLLKTAGRDDVLDAVRRVNRGELVFPPEVSAMVLAELRTAATAATAATSTAERTMTGLGSLTPREHDVLRLVASGASNHGVAKQLHLSAKTVEAHIATIFAKLGLEASADEHRRVQAAVRFVTESQVPTEG